MARKTARILVTLECTESHTRNYVTSKNRQSDPGRMELMKYCPVCKKHTLHRETK